MPKFKKCDETVYAMAREILCAFPSHKPLLDAKVRIDLVFAYANKGDALKLNGVKCGGIAHIISQKNRLMGRGDVEVSLDEDWWSKASDAERRALLDHELHHFEVSVDSNGRAYLDDVTRPVIHMREHDYDFGWFSIIAQRHGLASQECQQADMIMRHSGKLFYPEFSQLGLSYSNSKTTMAKALAAIKVNSNDHNSSDFEENEETIQQCIEVIRSEQKASVSLLQRRLRLGYIPASRIMDELEHRGIVGPSKGAEPREILIEQ